MRILFDSKKAEFKTPFGCVAPGQTVTLHLHIPTAVSAWKVEIVLCYEDGSPARYHEMYRIEQRGAYDIYEGPPAAHACSSLGRRDCISFPNSAFRYSARRLS